jgi:hypothetical protein
MAEKPNARTKFIDFVKEQGWELDPDKQLTSTRGFGKDRTEVKRQDPYAFRKAAAHGGTWMIKLDYTESGGYSYATTGNTLRRLMVTYRAGAGEPTMDPITNEEIEQSYVRYNHTITLRKPGNYDPFNAFWEALEHGDDAAKDATLKERAEKIVRNPDLAVWLAAAARFEHKEAIKRSREAARIDRELRSRPMPVLVTTDGYNSDWKQLTRALQEAATDLNKADGKSDLPRLVAEAYVALNAITAVLTEDAREEAQDLVAILTREVAVDAVELDA